MMRTIERGTIAPSPSETVLICCGRPSSVPTKSPGVKPHTGRPFASRTSTSQTTSEVSMRTTSSSESLPCSSLPLACVSTAAFFCSSHLSRFRLEPKSLSAGLSGGGGWVWADVTEEPQPKRPASTIEIEYEDAPNFICQVLHYQTAPNRSTSSTSAAKRWSPTTTAGRGS